MLFADSALLRRIEGAECRLTTDLAATMRVAAGQRPVFVAAIEKSSAKATEAQTLIDFLRTPASQRTFAEHGLRPVLPAIAAETQSRFATVEDLFTIRDLGGWAEAQRLLFDENGIYDQALARGRQEAP